MGNKKRGNEFLCTAFIPEKIQRFRGLANYQVHKNNN